MRNGVDGRRRPMSTSLHSVSAGAKTRNGGKRNAGIAGQRKPQRQVGGMPDADSGCDLDWLRSPCILAQLQGRMRIEQIETVLLRARSEEHTSELQSHVNLVC